MADLSSVDTVKALSQNEVNKLNNAQLKKALLTITTTNDEEPSNNILLSELKDIKETLNEINTLKKEVKCLSGKLNITYKSIHQQQLFLEYIEGKDRRKNLVIYGLSESEDGLGANDSEKLRNVLNKAKCPTIDPTNFAPR